MSGVGRAAWGADDAQAVDPVNVSGGKSAVPDAKVPELDTEKSGFCTGKCGGDAQAPAAAPAALLRQRRRFRRRQVRRRRGAPSNDAAVQAVSPVDVSKNAPPPPTSATPTAPTTPEVPVAPAAAAVPAVVAPAAAATPRCRRVRLRRWRAGDTCGSGECRHRLPRLRLRRCLLPEHAPGMQSTAVPIATDGPLYPCTGIVLKYHDDHPGNRRLRS